jgi:DNA-binding transcriptional MerR regulator
MFKIGEFSKIAQVPGSVLRYYDQIGLLKPGHIDKWTGYRYYSVSQLPRLHRILALKELGLSLEQIAQMLDDELSTNEMRGMLSLRKAQVEQALSEEMTHLRQIEARLQFIESPEQPGLDIVLKSVPSQRYLSTRELLPNVDTALALMQDLIQTLPSRIGASSLGQFMTVVHSETLESNRLDLELGVTLTNSEPFSVNLAENRILNASTLPAVEAMATTVQLGGFENSCLSYGAIGQWIEENGYAIAGPGREVLIKPAHPFAQDEAVTEIQFPVVTAQKLIR